MKKTHLLVAIMASVAASAAFVTMPRATTEPQTVVRMPAWPSLQAAGVTDQIIVKLKVDETEINPAGVGSRRNVMAAGRVYQLSISANMSLTPVRQMSGGSHVLKLAQPMSLDQVQDIVARIARDPAVESVQPDGRRYPMQAVAINDPRFAEQWNLGGPTLVTGPFTGGTLATSVGGVNFAGAFNANRRGQGVRVAVLDTGVIFSNRDLGGRVVGTPIGTFNAASGYDFVSADPGGVFTTANDGTGRDNEALDPGNWITAGEAGTGVLTACPQAVNSDWHGTHTSGIIAANANNGIDIVGVAPSASLSSVRVLGKCGGYTSDIVDAIRWSAGIAVAGVPANTAPAQVLNLSLGGSGACTAAEQTAINDALGSGVKGIIVAAGNSNGADVSIISPASCLRVITVAAHDRNGVRASYSNIGAGVELSAPGGTFSQACINTSVGCGDGILSTFNNGNTAPTTDGTAFVIGTSEAAAHVSGVAAVALSANGALTRGQLALVLINSTRAFPGGSGCSTTSCGSGLVDSTAAATLALTPPADPGDWTTYNPIPPVVVQPPASGGGGGGGGGGGCVADPTGRPDLLLGMLVLGAAGMMWRRRKLARK